jgi:hypothetical protein
MRKLVEVGNMLQISLLDHIIIGNGNWFSFKEAGVVWSLRDLCSLLDEWWSEREIIAKRKQEWNTMPWFLELVRLKSKMIADKRHLVPRDEI